MQNGVRKKNILILIRSTMKFIMSLKRLAVTTFIISVAFLLCVSVPRSYVAGIRASAAYAALGSVLETIVRRNTSDTNASATETEPTHAPTFRGLSVSELPIVALDAVCEALFRGNKPQGLFRSNGTTALKSDAAYVKLAENCTRFVSERRYATRPANAEETDFPLAFSILMYKDVRQFERLLRAVYRPQNIYCVHVDAKSPGSVHAAVGAIVRCFGSNVFLLEPPKTVTWGQFSVLEPELRCMEELLRRNRKWKYFINLTGQEFPLMTNWQIVRILKAFNGSNNLEGTIKRRNLDRYAGRQPPPFNLTAIKGAVHIVAVRGFVEFAINDNRSKVLLDWVKTTRIPDETFFATLNHNPTILPVPGAYLGEPETNDSRYRFWARFKNWGRYPCAGKRHSSICIFSVGDLPLLASRPELIANKFHQDYEPLALDCMEQLLYRRLADQLHGIQTVNSSPETVFNTSQYKSQEFVWNHL